MNIYSLLLAFTVGMTCLMHGISFVVVPSSSLHPSPLRAGTKKIPSSALTLHHGVLDKVKGVLFFKEINVHWWTSFATAATLPLNVGSNFFTLYVLRSEFASKKELTSLAEKVDSLETRFDSLERRFDSLERRFDSLEGKVDLIYDLLIKKGKK